MIQKIQAYKSSDGTAHPTLEEAQHYELERVIEGSMNGQGELGKTPANIAGTILKESDKIIDILTMKPNSLPKARKINGGTKKRTPKHIAEQHTLPLNDPPKEAA